MSSFGILTWFGAALGTVACGADVLIKLDAGEPAPGQIISTGGFMTILLSLAISRHSAWMITVSAVIDGVLLVVILIAWANSRRGFR